MKNDHTNKNKYEMHSASSKTSRREFLNVAGLTIGGVAATQFVPWTISSAWAGDKKVMTVLGLVDSSTIGMTSMHEHVYTDFGVMGEASQGLWKSVDESMSPVPPDTPFDAENLGYLLQGGAVFTPEQLDLTDIDLMTKELALFKKSGGGTVVDCSPHLKGRPEDYPEKLAELSKRTGLHIIAATGCYSAYTWSDKMKAMSQKQLTALFVEDVTKGIHGTSIKAGNIKTAPNSWEDDERRGVLAGMEAANETGVIYSIHHGHHMNRDAVDQMHDELEKKGLNPERTIYTHAQGTANLLDAVELVRDRHARYRDTDWFKKYLDRGYTLSFDTFGINWKTALEGFMEQGDGRTLTGNMDEEDMAVVYELVKAGYSKQIVVGHDYFLRLSLKKYGGYGYGRLLGYVYPILKKAGLSDAQLDDIFVGNPARLLTV